MRLCYARHAGRTFIGLAQGARWLNLTEIMRADTTRFGWLKVHPEPTIVDLLAYESDPRGMLVQVVSSLRAAGRLDDYLVAEPVELLAPITRPSKILAVGRNYLLHAIQDSTLGVPDEPIIFAKAPSAIIGPDANVIYHDYVGRLDYEIELAVIIGKRTWRIPESQAMDHIAGYTVLNDITDRAMQIQDIDKHNPWLRSKSLDTFCPLGPYLVLTDEILDPHCLDLTLKVNGEVRQHSNTSKMIFNIPHIIAFISKHMTLEPGDIIATGTPEGIGPVQVGDVMEGSVSGLGTLTNQIVRV
ncbi:MAG: fumarylacetoacetate hydrolase family protein [Anaerolineae bacterium]|nr:fumarylacetoacetate hydrolase family protein [Anaerolineae bacterium]